MKVLKFPHPILFEVMPEVKVFDSNLLTNLDYMWETMKMESGIGLAANQVGLRMRAFVMEAEGGDRINAINPFIVVKSDACVSIEEGCLSAPGDFVIIPDRPEWVMVAYQDERGVFSTVLVYGLRAVCAVHEIEHLDGKNFMAHPSIPRNIRKRLAKKWSLR